jgi:hypothetical protein
VKLPGQFGGVKAIFAYHHDGHGTDDADSVVQLARELKDECARATEKRVQLKELLDGSASEGLEEWPGVPHEQRYLLTREPNGSARSAKDTSEGLRCKARHERLRHRNVAREGGNGPHLSGRHVPHDLKFDGVVTNLLYRK